MTGALPVLVATRGPGVTNAVNVVANAMQDRVPLIFLTGCVDPVEAETYTHQAMLRPVVKGSFRLAHGAVGAGLAKAIALALSGQPGPVHVDVPISVARSVAYEGFVPPMPLARPGLPPAHALQAALAVLSSSKRPLAITGVDAVNEAAGPAIAAFCRHHAIPLITTCKGKGLMDEGDPLCLGAAGLSPKADRVLMPRMAKADCIPLLGYDPIEMRIGWRNHWTTGQTVIKIAPMARSHGMHPAQHLLIAGLAETLPDLHHKAALRWPDGACKALKAAFAVPMVWGPHQVFDTPRRVMPRDTVITADSGAHPILVSQMWDCAPPRGMLQSRGLCTMDCAVPLAAGTKLGRQSPRSRPLSAMRAFRWTRESWPRSPRMACPS